MTLDNTFRPLAVRELEIFLKHLRSVIQMDHNLTFSFISSKYELLKWSAIKEMNSQDKLHIIVVEKKISQLVYNLMKYKIVEAPISASDFIKIILETLKSRVINDEGCKKIEYKDLEFISYISMNNTMKTKTIAKQKSELKRRFHLKNDYEIVFFMNILFSKPYSALKVVLECNKDKNSKLEKQLTDTRRDFYMIMYNHNSLQAGPVLNNTS